MRKPLSRDRGPVSEESTQTDFSNLDVLGGTPVPSTAIDACLWDGFHLNNGVKITNGAGVLLVNGEVFSWKPWNANRAEGEESRSLTNGKGLWEVGDESWGVLGMVWPKPGEFLRGLFCLNDPGFWSHDGRLTCHRPVDSRIGAEYDATKSGDKEGD